MAALCGARILIAAFPFRWWRGTLGGRPSGRSHFTEIDRARGLAADVEWAAKKLPFATKCLPRAMALSWLMRCRQFGHHVVIAVRPPELRGSEDQLHAWVEIDGEIILGELPGRWIETLRLGA